MEGPPPRPVQDPPSGGDAATREGRRRFPRGRLGGLLLLLAALMALGAGAVLFLVWWGGGVRAPAPEVAGDGAPLLAEGLPSELNFPVVYDAGRLIEMLEEAVPARVGDLGDSQIHPPSGIRYALEATREPFSVELHGDTVRLSTVLHYQGRASFASRWFPTVAGACAGSEAERPRARLTISSPLELDPDWSLRSNTTIEELGPLTSGARDRCVIAGTQFDLTELIMTTARTELEGLTREIDALVSAVDVRTPLERYWSLLQTPVLLDDGSFGLGESEDVWLAVEPIEIRGARLAGMGRDPGTVRLEVGVAARPRVVVGGRPSVLETPLPPLGEARGTRGFRVFLEGEADYRTLSGIATRELRAHTFHAAGRPVHVREARLRGLGDGRLAMELRVTGGVRGRLFLVGTPTFDRASNQIVVRDLDFHVETRNLLVRAAAWLVRAGFPEHVRRHARWPMQELLDQGRIMAHEGLNRRLSEEARLEGGLGSLELTEVAATREALIIRSLLRGDARVIFEPE